MSSSSEPTKFKMVVVGGKMKGLSMQYYSRGSVPEIKSVGASSLIKCSRYFWEYIETFPSVLGIVVPVIWSINVFEIYEIPLDVYILVKTSLDYDLADKKGQLFRER